MSNTAISVAWKEDSLLVSVVKALKLAIDKARASSDTKMYLFIPRCAVAKFKELPIVFMGMERDNDSSLLCLVYSASFDRIYLHYNTNQCIGRIIHSRWNERSLQERVAKMQDVVTEVYGRFIDEIKQKEKTC